MSALKLTPPSALEYFESLVSEDAHFPLLEAASAVAHVDHPMLDVQGVLATVDAWAAKLRARVAPDAAPVQRLRILNHYFFVDLGFAGNVNDYYDVANSYVHCVLDSRRGIPITLALLYIETRGCPGPAGRVSFPATSWSS